AIGRLGPWPVGRPARRFRLLGLWRWNRVSPGLRNSIGSDEMGYQINQTASEGNNSQHPPVRRIDRRAQNGKIDCSQASVAIAQTDGAVVLAVTGVDVVELASRLLNSGMLDRAVSPIDKRVQAGLAADGCQVKVEAVVLAQTEKPIVVQPETDIAGTD